MALVQHAPWGGDGGAEETAYGLQCLDYWLRSPAGLAIVPDLVYFQFGLCAPCPRDRPRDLVTS